MKGCEFEGDGAYPCPVPTDTSPGDIRLHCEDTYGENCAGIIGQKLIAATFEPGKKNSTLDAGLGLITHFAKITELPAGEAPESFRETLVDMSFPLRQHRPSRGVNVGHIDLVATLLDNGKMREANWYVRYSAQQAQRAGKAVLWWTFKQEETEVTTLYTPRNTLEHYDRTFTKGHPALWNSLVPPMVYVRHAIDGSALSRNVPIQAPPKRGLLRKLLPFS